MTDAIKGMLSVAGRGLLMASAAVCLLAACGQKGPLYMPDESGEVVTRPTQTPQQTPQSPQQVPSPVDSEQEGASKPPR